MTTEEKLYLLIIEESDSDAESLANELRNAGYDIELEFAAALEDIETSPGNPEPDIVICGSGADLPAATDVRARLDELEVSAPVIAIGDEACEDSVIAARKAGISALVSYDRPEHLHIAFRELANLAALRKEQAALSLALHNSEQRTHSLIEKSSDAIAYIHDGMHVYANKSYMGMFGIDLPEDIEGMPILDMISSEQNEKFRDYLKLYDSGDADRNTLNIDCINTESKIFSSTMEFSPASMDGESCTQIIIRNRSGGDPDLEKRIESLMHEDMLTGLWNRQYFMQQLGREISAGASDDLQRALVYLTLDNFKVIREEAGIATSDLVLCDIANLLNKELAQDDMLSRFGDYSFALLKQGTDMEKLRNASEKILGDIAGHLVNVADRSFTMTASIGICEINNHTTDAQRIISFADMACEVARTSGGNQIHTHSTAVEDSIDLDMEKDGDHIVRDTIDNERFYLAYQPIVSLKGDKSQQYEVLLRITDPQGHVILPGEFLSIAKRVNLAPEIDRWVINAACSSLSEYSREHGAIFYIKISEETLAEPGFADWISSTLQEYGFDGQHIVFEISEHAAAKHLRNAINFTEAMHRLKCRIALEHFGTREQVSLLSHIPVDIVKIDGSLIGSMATDSDALARVKTVAGICREKDTLCIAECVDDANVLAMLWQCGIDAIQGFFVQEPGKSLDYEFESEIV